VARCSVAVPLGTDVWCVSAAVSRTVAWRHGPVWFGLVTYCDGIVWYSWVELGMGGAGFSTVERRYSMDM